MRTVWLGFAACLAGVSFPGLIFGQAPASEARVCECGAHPPGPPRDRTVAPYAGEPDDLKPYSKFAAPYDTHYTHPTLYLGAARDIPDPKDLTEVRIGFFGPLENNSESVLGQRMLHGAQLAVEEANAGGGYGGKPFKLMLHNDYNNWQAMAVYGDVRPTDPAIWGSASDEAVKMVYDDKDWAIFGSINAESTHIALRLALRAEIPVVNSANTDPTVPETAIPWYFGAMQDDRQQDLTLARHIYTEIGLKRVAVIRSSSRYGRLAIGKFLDASRRLGHPVVMEQIFQPGETDFTRALGLVRNSRADGVVIWGDELEAAAVLKQMHAAGMKQQVFGAYRTLGDTLLQQAGDAAEGFQAVYPFDPTRDDPRWLAFERRFENRFHEKPEQFAAMAYDTMNMLLDSICKAGLNRARIHDALANIEHYEGVTGPMIFDPNQKNVAPLFWGTVHNGAITYRPATMETMPAEHPVAAAEQVTPIAQPAGRLSVPYARVGEDGVGLPGPSAANAVAGLAPIVIFGADAEEIARSPEIQAELETARRHGRRLRLIPIASRQNWGAASTGLVNALTVDHAVAIIALDHDAAHLAEQLALKMFVPVIALSDDTTLTSTNVPWIFRLPARTPCAHALQVIEKAVGSADSSSIALRSALASGRELAGITFKQTGEPDFTK